ncbi:MAG: heavy-metal-associated domain-containing protein [Bacillota bacterium]|nr:heavy-metal-associated domain-containing protein [Bacillota bacterium]
MKKIITIEGMSCGHCEGRVKKELEKINNIKSTEVSATDKRAVVELTNEVEEEKLKLAVEEAGYTPIKIQ